MVTKEQIDLLRKYLVEDNDTLLTHIETKLVGSDIDKYLSQEFEDSSDTLATVLVVVVALIDLGLVTLKDKE